MYKDIMKCNTVAVLGARLHQYCAGTPPVLRQYSDGTIIQY